MSVASWRKSLTLRKKSRPVLEQSSTFDELDDKPRLSLDFERAAEKPLKSKRLQVLQTQLEVTQKETKALKEENDLLRKELEKLTLQVNTFQETMAKSLQEALQLQIQEMQRKMIQDFAVLKQDLDYKVELAQSQITTEGGIILEEIKLESERVKQETEMMKIEKEEMQEVYQFQTNHVTLNIGGTIFETSLDTLRRCKDSLLTIMFSGNHELKKDDQGRFFIDRDGSNFSYILNFLRCGKVSLPEDPELLEEIRIEAEYYKLDGLLTMLANHQNNYFEDPEDYSSPPDSSSPKIRQHREGEALVSGSLKRFGSKRTNPNNVDKHPGKKGVKFADHEDSADM